MSVKVTGQQDLLDKLEGLADEGSESAVYGLEQWAQEVLGLAQQLVPVDTGELHNSGYVETRGNAVEVGFAADHAIYVHEDLSAHHPNGGQAKFLESAADQLQPQLEAVVAQSMAELGKGRKR